MLSLSIASAVGEDQATPKAKDESGKAEKQLRDPLVVLKQSYIKGKVFLLAEEDKDVRGSDIQIEVTRKNEEQVLFKTVTEETGDFGLPNLDVGSYSLRIGRLRIELRVESPQETDGEKTTRKIPKTVLVYIPEDMR
jgi:hypothetical protein